MKTCFSKHWPSAPMLSISRNVRLSVRLSVPLSVRGFTFEVPFKRLFCPHFPKLDVHFFFRDLESLGKINGNKWSQIFVWKWSKIAKKKRFFFG